MYSFKDLGVIAERHVEPQKVSKKFRKHNAHENLRPSDGLEVPAKTPKALN